MQAQGADYLAINLPYYSKDLILFNEAFNNGLCFVYVLMGLPSGVWANIGVLRIFK